MSRIATVIGVFTAAFAALAVGVAAPAQAHVPFLEPARSSDAAAVPGDPFPGAVPVPDAAISRAVYGTLVPGERFDVYRLNVSEPVRTPVEVLVPRSADSARFRPAFALVGPGVPTAGVPPDAVAAGLRTAYGTAARSNVHVVPDPGAEPRPTFYEPFSFSTYYRGGETSVDMKPGRDYYVVVYDPAGGSGEYTLGIAEAESFTPADWVRSVIAVIRIKVGLYGQGAFHPLTAAVLVALVAVVTGLVVWLWRRRRRRRAALRARATAAGP